MTIIERMELGYNNNLKNGISKEVCDKIFEELTKQVNEYLSKGFPNDSEKYSLYISLKENIKSNIVDSIFEIVKDWEVLNKSPYSKSYYNSNDIEWDYKPEGSLRISNHWNFESQGQLHCRLNSTSEYTQKWLLCEYKEGEYNILKEL